MTHKEAIEQLTVMANDAWVDGREPDADACQHAIDALKRELALGITE